MPYVADAETVSERLALTLELFEFGVDMMAAALRRPYPAATPEEIAHRLEAWFAERPGAEPGACAWRTLEVSARATRPTSQPVIREPSS